MRLLLNLIKAYPWRTAIALVAILLAGIADGLSITALLPLLNIATRGRTAEAEILPEAGAAGPLRRILNSRSALRRWKLPRTKPLLF